MYLGMLSSRWPNVWCVLTDALPPISETTAKLRQAKIGKVNLGIHRFCLLRRLLNRVLLADRYFNALPPTE